MTTTPTPTGDGLADWQYTPDPTWQLEWKWRDGNGPWTDGIGGMGLALRSASNGYEVHVEGKPIAEWVRFKVRQYTQSLNFYRDLKDRLEQPGTAIRQAMLAEATDNQTER